MLVLPISSAIQMKNVAGFHALVVLLVVGLCRRNRGFGMSESQNCGLSAKRYVFCARKRGDLGVEEDGDVGPGVVDVDIGVDMDVGLGIEIRARQRMEAG